MSLFYNIVGGICRSVLIVHLPVRRFAVVFLDQSVAGRHRRRCRRNAGRCEHNIAVHNPLSVGSYWGWCWWGDVKNKGEYVNICMCVFRIVHDLKENNA